jgi:hypothetical protein
VVDISPEAKYHIVGFDTETIRDYSNANMIHTTQVFYKPDYWSNTKCDFHIKPIRGVKRLEDFPQKSLIFAHNLDFDLTNILGEDLKWLARRKKIKGWNGFFTFGQATNLARFKNKELGYDLKFVDTCNFYSGSLKQVANAELPLKKLDKPSYLGFREPYDEEKMYFAKYAVRDAELCYLLGLKIYEDYFKMCGGFAYTKAGLAVKSFRHLFLSKPFYLPDKIDMQFIWNAFNGARFESYGRGMFKNVSVGDVNSLYPYAATFPMPFSNPHLTHLTLEEYERDKDIFIGWCKISGKYKTEKTYPVIPQRTNRLYFPLEFEDTYLTTYELEPALKDIDLSECKIRGFYPTEADIKHPLKNYVEFYYEKKKELDDKKDSGEKLTESEKTSRNFYKAMMNHLYGKTGERHKHYNKKGQIYEVAGKFFNPFVCSLITGKSRAILGGLVNKYKALYADTDSVVTNRPIQYSTNLGGLKEEARGDILLIRPKVYFVLQDEKVIKCARHSFRVKFKDEQYCRKGLSGCSGKTCDKCEHKKSYGELLYEYIQKYRKSRTIPYQIEIITKFKESVRRDLNFLTNVKMGFNVSLKADIRRRYFRNYNTLEELEVNNTLSLPVRKAI